MHSAQPTLPQKHTATVFFCTEHLTCPTKNSIIALFRKAASVVAQSASTGYIHQLLANNDAEITGVTFAFQDKNAADLFISNAQSALTAWGETGIAITLPVQEFNRETSVTILRRALSSLHGEKPYRVPMHQFLENMGWNRGQTPKAA